MAMFSLANAAGAAFRAALNTVLGKLHGNYYGSTDPSAAAESTPGMLWVDTNGGTPVLKARNAADTGWITLGALDPAAFQLAGTSAFGRSLIDDASSTAAHGTLGTLSFLGNKVPTGATDLGASANLNTVTTPGFYQQPISANAASGSNYPVAQAGALAVYETGAKLSGVGAGVVQVYTQYWRAADGQARMFFRSEYNNTWSPWAEIVTTAGLGVGQTWVDVSGSRSNGTTYQNTTGRPIQWLIRGSAGSSVADIQVSANGSDWMNMGQMGSSGVWVADMALIIPHGYRYRCNRNFTSWKELR